MMTENIQALVAYRLEQADEPLDLRQRSDYATEYHASSEEAEITLKNAETFVDEVKKVLSKEM